MKRGVEWMHKPAATAESTKPWAKRLESQKLSVVWPKAVIDCSRQRLETVGKDRCVSLKCFLW